MSKQLSVGVILFEGFELLDVFGPLEMLGVYPDTFSLHLLAEKAGAVKSAQGPTALAESEFVSDVQYDILLVPGGRGTRTEVSNTVLLDYLCKQAVGADFVVSICTGSALLAKAGLLDGLQATTNKMALEWVASQGPNVNWIKQARWVEEGKFFTSSGVSAGMDMALGLIAKIQGEAAADQAAIWTEYDWHKNASWDPFAKIAGLV